MRQWTGSALVQAMAWRLFGANPLPEIMMVYCQLDSWEQISVKFKSEFYHFHSRKCLRNCRLPKWWPFCPGRRWVKWISYCMKQDPSSKLDGHLHHSQWTMWCIMKCFGVIAGDSFTSFTIVWVDWISRLTTCDCFYPLCHIGNGNCLLTT